MVKKKDDWDGVTERRDFCTMCKKATDDSIKSACSKAKTSMYTSLGLLGVCFILSGIAWSAKSDVKHQKDTIVEIRKEQKEIAQNINKITEFVDLLKKGNIRFPRDNHNSTHQPNGK